jgi:RNA polymerase sigma factor for flagellar operon FliA
VAEQTPGNLFAAQQALVDRDELVERYRPYVYSIVKQVTGSFPFYIDFEELVSYGMVGLLEAADRYDPRRKVSFVTFSHYRIKGAVFDGLRQMGILTRTPNDAWVRREAVLNDLIQTASDDDTDGIHSSVDDEIQTVERFVDSLIPAYLLSLSEESAPDVQDGRELPNVAVEFEETVKLVRQTVRELPDKEREIIESLYFKHLSTTELAKQMGVNKSWVSRLHSKAVTRLRQRLAAIGVLSNE